MTPATGTAKAKEAMELRWDPECLPPFPGVALKALNLISGTDTSLPALCNLIRTDPAFSTAVLRIANSPLVAFSKEITTVLQASMLLGFRRLRSIVITVGLKSYLQNFRTPVLQACWRHSVACAMIAERAAQWSGDDEDFAYTAGILHDIGRIALATLMPHAYARVIERGANQPWDLLQSEQELCGIDHCQAGHSLVTEWNLPAAFLEITSRHHGQEPHARGAASLIEASCALADALGFTMINYRSPVAYAEILADFPDWARNHFPCDAQGLATEIATEIKVIESA